MLHKFGHGISYSLLEEIATENAFKSLEKEDEDGVILPDHCKKDALTIIVADNIDRLEETLSGR